MGKQKSHELIRIKRHHSLMIIAGMLVVSIAVLAALNLWFLRKMHSRSLHDTAARSVLGLGSELAHNLANHPVIQSERDDPRRWADFARWVRALKGIEPSLQYVTVNEGDVTYFHEDTSRTNDDAVALGLSGGREVRVGHKLLATEAGVVPVLTFSAKTPDVGGGRRVVQIAMRKDAVLQREEQASRMLEIMFRLSIITLSVALGLAVILAVWLVRHELERQRRRRDEEHLAFAGLLADGIIHDVRNPMSSLRLDVQMLEKEAGKVEGCRAERIAELAVRARTTMDRMDLVMREFLFVSKPDSREPELFEINACVRDCLDLLGPRFERAGVSLCASLCAAPLNMVGTSVGLKRAIINVLTNAKQVSSSGQRVMISLQRVGNDAILKVEDEGPGIAKADLSSIFDMFVSGRPDGIGLGLYLAKAAVENNGGTISVENCTQGGACFTILLPLRS